MRILFKDINKKESNRNDIAFIKLEINDNYSEFIKTLKELKEFVDYNDGSVYRIDGINLIIPGFEIGVPTIEVVGHVILDLK